MLSYVASTESKRAKVARLILPFVITLLCAAFGLSLSACCRKVQPAPVFQVAKSASKEVGVIPYNGSTLRLDQITSDVTSSLTQGSQLKEGKAARKRRR